MTLWRKTSAFLAAGLAAGVVSPVTPIAVAQELSTRSTAVTHSCAVVHNTSALNKEHRTKVTPDSVTSRYPAIVAPGEIFTAYVQPGPMTTASGSGEGYGAGRLSYDLAFPTNSTNLGAVKNGGESGFSSAGTIMAVDRVGSTGAAQALGPYARIWGGESAVLESGQAGTWANDWQGGLQVPGNTTFRFPEVALRMRAPVTAGGSTIAVGLKGAGTTNGSTTNGANNTVQGAEKAGYFGSYLYTTRFYCNSSANASALSSTVVSSSLPRYLAKTSTRMVTPATLLPLNARTMNLTAEVSSSEELMSNISPGGMNFTIRNKATGQVLATVPNVAIGTDGRATVANYAFPALSAGSFRDEYEVTASYAGRANDIEASTSDPVTVAVGYNEVNVGVVLTSTNGSLTGGTMPVTLRAAFSLPAGKSAPAGLAIQLYRNDQPLGAPTAINAGTTTANYTFPTDTLTQYTDTRTYRYRAEIVPVISGVERYVGGSATPVAAIVVGSSPGSPLPDGGEGSVSLEGFFRAPQLVWDWLSGSMGQAGTFSLGFAN
ncbi:hypothetical protein [Rhodococcus sp. IEGM 1408]|uniref:hypothetical protein n=1 Tax=Rhodococcus sp. IEGM 1408 TaxID=3082220 RepID=UPI0029548719|nr:hypothetical protein [Rhodococcus sp. IEGM 1408]MDV8001822.1 hypothetical protein [Rhodococcus sp. IEGM 1408]